MREKQNKSRKKESTFCFQCHMTDPIARLLINRLQMSPMKFAGIGLALGLGYAFLVRLGSEQQSLLYHWDSLLFGGIFIPIIAFAYIWIIAAITQIMQQLYEQGPAMKDEAFFNYLSLIQQSFNRRFWMILSTVLATINALSWGILMIIKLLDQPYEYGWLMLISILVAAGLIFIFTYIVAMTLFRGVLTVYSVKRLVIDVAPEYDPFHSDGWAGFTPIGEFAMRMFYILAGAVSGIAAITVETSQNLVSPAYIGLCYLLYIVAIAVLVIAPIMFVRNYLHMQKEKSIQQLTSYTHSLYQSLMSTKDRDGKDISSFIELMLVRKAIKSFPEWPTSIRNLWRILSIVAGAVMPIVVSLLAERLISLFL